MRSCTGATVLFAAVVMMVQVVTLRPVVFGLPEFPQPGESKGFARCMEK